MRSKYCVGGENLYGQKNGKIPMEQRIVTKNWQRRFTDFFPIRGAYHPAGLKQVFTGSFARSTNTYICF